MTTEDMCSPEDFAVYPPNVNDISLLKAVAEGDLELTQKLLTETDADPCFQDIETGMSVLMAAAGSGNTDVVHYLLSEGAPWNALDRQNRCAGDYATRNGHQEVVDCILNHAVTAEMIFSTMQQATHSSDNATYLQQTLNYTAEGDKLIDEDGLAVMMDWEKPLMEAHADFICARGGRVMNVGFGMGIVDTAIAQRSVNEHYILEAHPEVLQKLRNEGWYDKPGVVIVEGRWQDSVPKLIAAGVKFDGIFFDTYAEDDFDLRQFHTHLPQLMNVNGHYSFYNGMCPDNVFFHAVACETTRLNLKQYGFNCEFDRIPVDVHDNKLWSGIRKRYWYFDCYYLPKCNFIGVN